MKRIDSENDNESLISIVRRETKNKVFSVHFRIRLIYSIHMIELAQSRVVFSFRTH